MKDKVATYLKVDLEAYITPDTPYTWDFVISHYLKNTYTLAGLPYREIREICQKPPGMMWNTYFKQIKGRKKYEKPAITSSYPATVQDLKKYFGIAENCYDL